MTNSAPAERTPPRRTRYLRPATPPPVPRSGVFVRYAGRWLPAATLLGIVVVVLLGRGFWPEGQLASPRIGPTDTIGVPDASATPGVGLPPGVTVNVPGGQTVIPAPPGVIVSDLNGANYVSRPALTITSAPQRIELVRAKRDESLTEIAARAGVNTSALLYANDLTDAERPLPVGLAVRVPPRGAMLHRIKDSDTLESIARAFRVKVDDIVAYPGNNVQQTGDLIPGGFLIVPTTNTPVRDRVIFYQVREGDSLGKIVTRYGLRDPLTLSWANSLQNENFVQPGQIIAVPPADGVIYVVKEEDTQRPTDDAVMQIAKNYACLAIPCREAPTDARTQRLRDEVFAFGPNHLTRTGRLIPGQEIIIPGGIPYVAPPPVVIPRNVRIDNPEPRPNINPPTPRPVQRPGDPAPPPIVITRPGFPGVYPSFYYPAQGPGSGRNPGFLWPEIGNITSTYNGYHNGIDIATTFGTPLKASAAGYVVYSGWTTSGLGIAVYVDHGNGFVTVYGHMSDVAVRVGDYVAQGQYIGPQGSTGNSTGPHVHFMIIENGRSVNPFNYLSG